MRSPSSEARENGQAGRIQALRELARIVAFNRGLPREAPGTFLEDPEPDPLGVSMPEPPEEAEDPP